MKRLITIFCLLSVLAQGAYSQESSLFSHFYLDETFYNPAFVGSMGYPVVHLVYRKQWAGIQGSPETMMFYGNMHVNNMGFGARIYQDNTGIFSRTGTRLSYSYMIDFHNKHTNRLAFGMSVGFLFNNINFDRIKDVSDPVLYGMNNTFSVDGDFGLAYFYKNLEIGFALPQLFNRRLSNNAVKDGLLKYLNQSITSIGYKWYIYNDRLMFMPLLIYKIGVVNRGQFDMALSAHWEDNYWVAYTYRTEFGNAFSAGFRVKDFSISYAYEMSGNGMGSQSSGSNELMLSYHFGGNKKKYVDPKEDNYADNQVVMDTIKVDENTDIAENSTDSDTTNTESSEETTEPDDGRYAGNSELQSFKNPKIGKTYVLKNMNFESGKAIPKAEAYPYMDNLAEYLLKNPDLKIEIGGHTDSKGKADSNLKLSQDRAAVVMRYLAEKGISPDRMTAKGYGDAKPLARHEDDDYSHLNRRIEITVIE